MCLRRWELRAESEPRSLSRELKILSVKWLQKHWLLRKTEIAVPQAQAKAGHT